MYRSAWSNKFAFSLGHLQSKPESHTNVEEAALLSEPLYPALFPPFHRDCQIVTQASTEIVNADLQGIRSSICHEALRKTAEQAVSGTHLQAFGLRF